LRAAAARRESLGGDGHRRTFIRSTPAERSEGEGGRTLWPGQLRCDCLSWLGHAGCRGRSEVMTEDRDFKQVVRERAAKTGESYQTARRILERKRGRFSALANSTFVKPAGRVLGCIIEDGKVTRGMKVTVTTPDGGKHQAVVVSLRHMWDDVDSISYGEFGEFGMLLEPPYDGPIPAQVTG
jgi:hypothetical protein